MTLFLDILQSVRSSMAVFDMRLDISARVAPAVGSIALSAAALTRAYELRMMPCLLDEEGVADSQAWI